MKKILIAVLLSALSVPALAQGAHYHGRYLGPYHHHHHGHHSNYSWVTPLIIGGAVGYVLSRPAPAPNPPVIVQSTLPPAPLGFHYEQVLDANCNCYRWILIAN